MSLKKITYEDEDHFLFWREDINNHSLSSGPITIQFNHVGITDNFIFFLDARGNRVATTEPNQLDPQLLNALEEIENIQREAV